jgi:hypothetical protein
MTHPTPLAEKIAAIEKALRIYSKAQWALDMADALAERAKDVAAMEEALGKLPRTADGVVTSLNQTVYVVRSLAAFDPGYGRGPRDESSPVFEATVAWLGKLGSRRIGLIEGAASFTITPAECSIFSTRDAALAAAAKGQGTVTT